MERFVFVAAVTFAVIFALVAMVGNGHWNVGHGEFNIEFHDERVDEIVAVAPGRMEVRNFAGDELVLRHIAARVTITPEDRADFSIEIDNPGRVPMPLVSAERGNVRVNGQLGGRISECSDGGGVKLEGYGEFAPEDLPQINIRAPRTLEVSVNGAGATQIGSSEILILEASGCSSVSAGDVVGALAVEVSGAGAVTAGNARSLRLEATGAGDFSAAAIAEGAVIEITGAGKANLASVTGALEIDSTGAGGVSIHGGALSEANIELSGANDVEIAAPIQHLIADIIGPGSIRVTATVGDVEAEIKGPGSVHLAAVSGRIIRQEVAGPGAFHVGP